MPAYTPPSYNAIRTKLLTAKMVDLDRQVKEKMGNSVDKYGVTICCDGWDNVQNKPLLNVLHGTKGDVFLGTIDTTGNHKDHVYVAAQIQLFVEKVGRHNVVQVCIDNAPIMASACRDLIRANPDLYVRMCCALLRSLLRRLGEGRMGEKIGIKKMPYLCFYKKPSCSSSYIPEVVTKSLTSPTCRVPFCNKLHHDRSSSSSTQCFGKNGG
jgi:hypothetical protein